MQLTGPVYADGIVKGKQTKFGGLNHNEGAGDGEIYAMKNLTSDCYPLLATRNKRKHYRTLTSPNGLYAWNKLCWVDWNYFYYDGERKGEVTPGQKRFAAINDTIIILPDMKYYDTVEDRFGSLAAEVSAPPGDITISIDTTPDTPDTFSATEETNFTWTNEAPSFTAGEELFWANSTLQFGTDRVFLSDGKSGSLDAAGFRQYIGQRIYFDNVSELYNCGAKTLTAVDTVNNALIFREGDFKAGTYSDGGRRTSYISLWTCELRPVIIGRNGNTGTTGAPANTVWCWYNRTDIGLFNEGDVVSISTPDENVDRQVVSGLHYSDNHSTGFSVEEYSMHVNLNVTGLVTVERKSVSPVVFRERNTIYCEGINWAEHAQVGYTIQIIGSNLTVQHITTDENDELQTTEETVTNDGVYIVRRIDGHSLVCDDGSFTNGTDSSTREYYLSGDGIHFVTTDPSAAIFTDNGMYCAGQWAQTPDWGDLFQEGNYVSISNCSIAENNISGAVRGVNGYEILFEDGTFTPGVDTDGILITREMESPIIFRDGTIYGVHAEANTIYCNGISWSDYFKPGDAVEISGCSIEANNQTLIVREIEGHEMRFYENSFTNGVDLSSQATFRRTVPELEFAFENENRLWGCKGNTIYASKLGDPFNFNVFDGLDTDSFAVDTGSSGIFTGACSYMGYPTFFKEENIYKVYGSKPSNFEIMSVARTGLAEGSGESLAVAGETLFYLNRNGICIYTGGIPQAANRAFGGERYRNAVGGSDGLKYYVSMQDSEGGWHLFVYDTQRGMWHEEDESRIISFAYLEGVLYALRSDGALLILRHGADCPECEEEEDFEWYAEFTDFTDDSPNKKELKKLQLRIELDEGAQCTVKLQWDGDGEWKSPQDGTLEDEGKRSYYLAVIPRRADYYRMRLEGTGGCRVYGMARSYNEGSEMKSMPGRQ